MNDDVSIFYWKSLEHNVPKKSNDWFWGMGISAICICTAIIIWGNLLFAVFILVSFIILFIFNTKAPRIVEHSVTEKGILIDNEMFKWKELKEFWIDEFGELTIDTTKIFHPRIHLDLSNKINTEDLRDFLLKYLKEEEVEPSKLREIARNLGL